MKDLVYKAFNIFRSLRIRLFMIILVAGLIPCIMISSTILKTYEERAVSVRISDVSNQLRVIANHLITYNYLTASSSEVIDAEMNQLSNLYDGRILIINGDLKVIKDTYGISQGKTIISEEVIRCLRGEVSSNYDRNNGYIEFTIPITQSMVDEVTGEETELVSGILLASASTDTIEQTREILSRHAVVQVWLMLVGVFAIALVLVYFILKPFRKLTVAVSEMKEGHSDDPVMVREYLETEQICNAFNQVFGRMKSLDDSRQEFVSNVSHELKTPLTSMKILADSLLTQPDVPAELYREFMDDIAHEIDRENSLINDLIAMVKMDKSIATVNISEVDVNALLEVIMKRLRPIARKQNVDLIYETNRNVVAAADEVKLTMIFTNLIENAIKYNVEHGYVRVTLDADHQYFVVVVEDSGIGIPQESLDHIFERFYRVDKSHSREIGGTGLGLSIVRSSVQLQKGTIAVESKPEQGTTFTVKIPLNYIAGNTQQDRIL